MCIREGMSLQRGMNFRAPPAQGIILMSRRPNAPYDDEMSADEAVIFYEGHDVHRTKNTPFPKSHDQPRYNFNGNPTENGKFADWVDASKEGSVSPAIFRVYEKMKSSIWTDRGLYTLEDYQFLQKGSRKVFRFQLQHAGFDSVSSQEQAATASLPTRQIPSWVKQFVYKRDNGKCVICGSEDFLHFDHDFPYSKGGASVIPENVRILCARHNLAKSANIE